MFSFYTDVYERSYSSRIYTHNAACPYSHSRRRVFCLSVYAALLVTAVSPAETAQLIEMPFGL